MRTRWGAICLFFAWVANADAVHLSGKVVDDKSAPLAGALVKLKRAGYSAVTGGDGSFLIGSQVSIFPIGNLHVTSGPRVSDGGLVFPVAKDGERVSIRAVTAGGRALGPLFSRRLGAGTYRFTPGAGRLQAARAAFVVLEVGGRRSGHRILAMGGQESALLPEPAGTAVDGSLSLGKASAATADTLVVSKESYSSKSVAVTVFSADVGSLMLNRLILDSTGLAALGADSLYKLVLARFKAAKYDSSIALAQTYLARFPGGTNADNAQYYMARSLFEQGQMPQARAAFQLYIQKYPSGTSLDWAHNYIGRSFLDQGAYDSSRTWFGLVLSKFPDSSSADNSQYYIGLGHYGQKNYPTAAASFSSLIATYPKSPLLADAHLYLGKSQYHQSAYPAAMAEFNTVLVNFATSTAVPDAQLGLGDVYLAMGATDSTNYPKALAAFQLVVANHPASGAITGAIEGEGESYYYLRDYANARIWLGRIGVDYPLSIYVSASYYWLGLCDLKEAKYDNALALFTKLETDYPKSEKAGIALYQMGKCNYLKKAYPQALADFLAFRSADPNSQFADNSYYYTVRIYVLQKNCVQAKAEFAAMQKSYPQSTVLASTQKYMVTGGCP